MNLIPDEQLKAAAERLAQAQAEKPASEPARAFEYKPRSLAQYLRRANQSYRDNQSFVPPKPAPELDFDEPESIQDPDVENDESGVKTPKAKISSTTLCLCGHQRSDHHTTPEPHTIDGEHAHDCITSHCDVRSFKNGVWVPCPCVYFRATANDAVKLTRPRVGDYDRCGNPACGHFKIDHCTKAKPGKSLRLKPREVALRILQKPDGTSYGCKHFSITDRQCQCDSTSCSHTSDGVNFCECEKFISPFAKVKAKASNSRKKESPFLTTGELFPVATGTTAPVPES